MGLVVYLSQAIQEGKWDGLVASDEVLWEFVKALYKSWVPNNGVGRN